MSREPTHPDAAVLDCETLLYEGNIASEPVIIVAWKDLEPIVASGGVMFPARFHITKIHKDFYQQSRSLTSINVLKTLQAPDVYNHVQHVLANLRTLVSGVMMTSTRPHNVPVFQLIDSARVSRDDMLEHVRSRMRLGQTPANTKYTRLMDPAPLVLSAARSPELRQQRGIVLHRRTAALNVSGPVRVTDGNESISSIMFLANQPMPLHMLCGGLQRSVVPYLPTQEDTLQKLQPAQALMNNVSRFHKLLQLWVTFHYVSSNQGQLDTWKQKIHKDDLLAIVEKLDVSSFLTTLYRTLSIPGPGQNLQDAEWNTLLTELDKLDLSSIKVFTTTPRRVDLVATTSNIDGNTYVQTTNTIRQELDKASCGNTAAFDEVILGAVKSLPPSLSKSNDVHTALQHIPIQSIGDELRRLVLNDVHVAESVSRGDPDTLTDTVEAIADVSKVALMSSFVDKVIQGYIVVSKIVQPLDGKAKTNIGISARNWEENKSSILQDLSEGDTPTIPLTPIERSAIEFMGLEATQRTTAIDPGMFDWSKTLNINGGTHAQGHTMLDVLVHEEETHLRSLDPLQMDSSAIQSPTSTITLDTMLEVLRPSALCRATASWKQPAKLLRAMFKEPPLSPATLLPYISRRSGEGNRLFYDIAAIMDDFDKLQSSKAFHRQQLDRQLDQQLALLSNVSIETVIEANCAYWNAVMITQQCFGAMAASQSPDNTSNMTSWFRSMKAMLTAIQQHLQTMKNDASEYKTRMKTKTQDLINGLQMLLSLARSSVSSFTPWKERVEVVKDGKLNKTTKFWEEDVGANAQFPDLHPAIQSASEALQQELVTVLTLHSISINNVKAAQHIEELSVDDKLLISRDASKCKLYRWSCHAICYHVLDRTLAQCGKRVTSQGIVNFLNPNTTSKPRDNYLHCLDTYFGANLQFTESGQNIQSLPPFIFTDVQDAKPNKALINSMISAQVAQVPERVFFVKVLSEQVSLRQFMAQTFPVRFALNTHDGSVHFTKEHLQNHWPAFHLDPQILLNGALNSCSATAQGLRSTKTTFSKPSPDGYVRLDMFQDIDQTEPNDPTLQSKTPDRFYVFDKDLNTPLFHRILANLSAASNANAVINDTQQDLSQHRLHMKVPTRIDQGQSTPIQLGEQSSQQQLLNVMEPYMSSFGTDLFTHRNHTTFNDDSKRVSINFFVLVHIKDALEAIETQMRTTQSSFKVPKDEDELPTATVPPNTFVAAMCTTALDGLTAMAPRLDSWFKVGGAYMYPAEICLLITWMLRNVFYCPDVVVSALEVAPAKDLDHQTIHTLELQHAPNPPQGAETILTFESFLPDDRLGDIERVDGDSARFQASSPPTAKPANPPKEKIKKGTAADPNSSSYATPIDQLLNSIRNHDGVSALKKVQHPPQR